MTRTHNVDTHDPRIEAREELREPVFNSYRFGGMP
jgi:hypothetical protein